MKRLLALILPLFLTFTVCGSCKTDDPPTTPENPPEQNVPNVPDDGEFKISSLSEELRTNLSADGYVRGNISDFSQYENTSAYRRVSTADELITAIEDAKYHYANLWDNETGTYTQIPAAGYNEETIAGKVHVIEIENDINLGYNVLSESAKASEITVDYCTGIKNMVNFTMSDMLTENGMTQIKVENTSNLLIFSKNGARLTHCGFKLTSDNNVVFRNIEFDELWQWEDAPAATAQNAAIGDYDLFGWAYFKISFCGYIWIDHCTFGKSYDGQIDYSNPVYDANAGTAFRAPYGADGNNGLHISYCKFNAGSADEDGYIYKMMSAIENDYKSGGGNYLYYKTLRDGGASFEDILYGLAVPQKKGFLCGDDAKYPDDDDYIFNLDLQVSFANCTFTNLEDRIPKLRGGNAYLYNCIVDNSQYYSYRAKLQAINAKNFISQACSLWNCGLVSQGLVCGNGGSVKAENCVFKGIEYLLKNNDKKNSGIYVEGGYCLVNCTYQKGASDSVLTLNSDELSNDSLINASTSILKPANFGWHTEDGEQPFVPAAIALDELEESLNNEDYGAGVNKVIMEDFLKSSY